MTAAPALASVARHLPHLIPLFVPVVAIAAVFLPDALRKRWRALQSSRDEHGGSRGSLAVASLCSAVAAAVHFVVMPGHFGESALYGTFFLAAACSQAWYAAYLLLRPDRFLQYAGVVGSVAMVGLWLLTRTRGIPLGPERGTVEAVGRLDLIAVGAELLMAAALCRHLRLSRRAARRRVPESRVPIATSA